MDDRHVKLHFIAIQNILNKRGKKPINDFRGIKTICESALTSLFHDLRLHEIGRKKGTPNKPK